MYMNLLDVLPKKDSKCGTYEVFVHTNGEKIGEMYAEGDGYYVMWFEEHNGFHDSHYLHAIAQHLDRLNYGWDKVIRDDPTIGCEVENDWCI